MSKSPAALFGFTTKKRQQHQSEYAFSVDTKPKPRPSFLKKRIFTFIVYIVFLLLFVWLFSPTVFAATVVVVNDSSDASDISQGDGICDSDSAANGAQCTLRAAIEELNAKGNDPQPHEIHFNISGSGPHVIQVDSELPSIQVPIIVDGSTQPGVSCPTANQPANLLIELDGGNLDPAIITDGIKIQGEDSVVRGLSIGHFSNGIEIWANGVQVECNHIGLRADGVTSMPNRTRGVSSLAKHSVVIGGDNNHAQRNVISANGSTGVRITAFRYSGEPVYDEVNQIANNYIGTTSDGMTPLGNGTGIELFGFTEGAVLIGGETELARNVISGNNEWGIDLFAGYSQILGNWIGVGADGTTAVSNRWDGIYVSSGSKYNQIGGVLSGEANIIAHNWESGIVVHGEDNGFTYSNSMRGNVLMGNGYEAIDIGLDGADENDPLDTDIGTNTRLNYPVIDSVTVAGQISGTYSGAPNQTFLLDFYASSDCHQSGHGDAERYLGATAVDTDANGEGTFTFSAGPLALGEAISSTATDGENNTSELSACTFAGGAPLLPTLNSLTNCFDGNASPPPPISSGDERAYLPLIANDSGQALVNTAVANNTLNDGGVVTGVDGVSVGAVTGSLSRPIDITINSTSAPSSTILADPTIHGSYYEIASSENVTICGQELGLILGLPVPSGTSSTNLAVAVLAEGSTNWQLLSGLYNDSADLMLVQLSVLGKAGLTAVLIEHNSFSSQPTTQINDAQSAINTATFHSVCITNSNGCSITTQINDFLELVYIEMTDMGYPDPYLPCEFGYLEISPPDVECTTNSYVVNVVGSDIQASCKFDDAPEGVYWKDRESFQQFQLQICPTSTSQLFNIDKRAIRYHYFQATQFGDPDHQQTWLDILEEAVAYDDNDWVMTSTAAAAMISVPGVMESTNDYARRRVDIPLNSNASPAKYEAQDFWVYVGKSLDDGTRLLEPLFEKGGTLEAGIEWAGSKENFQDLYWNWVQNQVMLEDGFLLNDDDTGSQCTFQESSVTNLESLFYTLGSTTFDSIYTLPPLTSQVYHFTIQSGLYPAYLSASDSNPRHILQYKIYVDGENGCELVDDGPRWFTDVEWLDILAADQSVYIVVSNPDHELSRNYRFGVEAGNLPSSNSSPPSE